MIIEIIRRLFGFRTYEENFQAGVVYAQEQLNKYPGLLIEHYRLWAECDSGGIDANGFDAGIRQVLIMRNIPHPMDPPINLGKYDGKYDGTLDDCICGRQA